MLVEIEKSDGITAVRLNRPEVHNASNLALKTELLAALEEAGRDGTLRCLILTGNGRSFCTGGDIKEKPRLGAAETDRALGLQQAICMRLGSLNTVTIAALRGYALGGGLEMALSCDLRVAARDAHFGIPAGQGGSLATGGLHHRLSRAVGAGWATDLVLTGRTIDTETAFRIGLVTRLADEPVAAAIELARSLQDQSTESILLRKHLLRLGSEAGLATTMEAEHRFCLALK